MTVIIIVRMVGNEDVHVFVMSNKIMICCKYLSILILLKFGLKLF